MLAQGSSTVSGSQLLKNDSYDGHSPVQRSMRCLFSQASHHPQPHNTLLYQPECFLLPDEQPTYPEVRKRRLTFEASNGDAFLLSQIHVPLSFTVLQNFCLSALRIRVTLVTA